VAAPTDVRVEATSQGTTTLRWSYAGVNGIDVYRSTDGAAYTRITLPSLVSTVKIYEDSNLATGVKYWYKTSDDAGSTFSSVVTVWTHGCAAPTENIGVALPRFADEADPTQLNDMAQTVESALNKNLSEQDKTCKACISDGALTIDCGCAEMEVEVDQDINSISVLNCDDKSTDVTFIIPPNVTRAIGGWPKGMGFTGDEGRTSPVSGGSTGRSINEKITSAINRNSQSGKSKPGVTTKGGKTGGPSTSSGGCQCVPGTNGELTIKVCKPDGGANNGNSMNCAAATKGAKMVACGGRGPYTWSKTGGVNISAATGGTTMVTLPTNAGSGEGGTAYRVDRRTCQFCSVTAGICSDTNPPISKGFGCNDQELFCVITSSCSAGSYGPVTATPTCGPQCSGAGNACPPAGDWCSTGEPAFADKVTCDERTAGMITAGCNPCGSVAASGTTVSVTDSLGTVTTVIMVP